MARTDPRPHYGTKRRTRPDGYVDIYDPTHPLARADGYVFEHRKMMWDAGLLTDPALEVHHKNEVRSDNYIDNLEVKDGAQHALDHAEERGYITNQYGTWVVKPREKRISAPRPERLCKNCEEPIPLTRRRDAIYCDERCRMDMFYRLHPGYKHRKQ